MTSTQLVSCLCVKYSRLLQNTHIIETDQVLESLLEGCRKNHPKSQELLYRKFYGYAMKICMRYAKSEDEAVELVNDGFIKVFNNLDKVDLSRSFKNWFHTIMVNTSLDAYRKNKKFQNHDEITDRNLTTDGKEASSDLSYNEIILVVQKLSPAYRTVFNLFVIEGYSHEEISKLLNISEGTSRSNLARARINLQEMLIKCGYDY